HKRKMQNFLPCKTSPQSRCDVSNGNGVIYEDLTNIRPRTLPNHCAPGQTAPSIEMIDVKSGANYNSGFPVLGNPSVFICPPPRPDPYTSQDLYNPVYEELSNGSGDRGESDPDSEGAAPAPASEDEFAEDELSLGGECEAGCQPGHPQHHPEDVERGGPLNSGTSSLQGSTGNDLCRDLDSSDADDRSRFLMNTPLPGLGLGPGGRNFSLPPAYRNRTTRAPQPHQHRTQHAPPEQRRPRSLDRRRGWRSKGQPQQISPQSPARHQDCAVPSVTHRLPYILQPPVPPPPNRNLAVNPYESVPVLNHLHQHHHGSGYSPRQQQELFSTFRRGKTQSQDSSFGSDSGYSNNTSSRGRSSKDAHRLSAHSGDLVLS
ncbi:hypothetical protein Cfor_03227, partial [Coptotermes formosanus]